jgi:hypothetical protein
VSRSAGVLAVFLPLILCAAEGPTAQLGQRILDAGLDSDECYHVRDLHVIKEDLRVYLTEGYLIFGKPVDGVHISAVFSGEVEGGDAEVLLLPPTRSERVSLASYAKTPNLDEHFTAALLVFTDNTYADLMRQIRARGEPRRVPEQGLLLASAWQSVLRNFAASFEIRLTSDLLTGNRATNGIFVAAAVSPKLGNINLVYDPREREQITVGQVSFRQEQAYFDIWTRFQARSFRNGTRQVPGPDVRISDYRINATMDPYLHLSAVTEATVTPGPGARRALSFDISSQMRVNSASIDGEPAEVFQPTSLRTGLIRGDLNQSFLVVPAKPLEPGREYKIQFHHEGDVVSDAGNDVYFVGARGSWYPNLESQFARYDITFRYPEGLDLVATGRTIEDSTADGWHITERRTDVPVRIAGFNLGKYERRSASHEGYTIDVYANRTLEAGLAQRTRPFIIPPRVGVSAHDRRWTIDLAPMPPTSPQPDPAARLHHLAGEISSELEFMTSRFGPPVLKHLTVSPIPGTFGQGFPGLIYLSTLAYLDTEDRPGSSRGSSQDTFFSDILLAHETAHQWWGNVVTSASDEDNWIMEALANYSALMYLEKRKGQNAANAVLESYKDRLLAKAPGGGLIDAAGPITWGRRLFTSHAPNAWRVITYEKGSWIIHMLRRRMGDERFFLALAKFREKYERQGVTTDQFRQGMAEGLPPRSPDPKLEAFFDQWVYGTGIPELKMSYRVSGKAPAVRVRGAIEQSGVDDDFSALVPLEIQFRKGKPHVLWLKTATGSTSFDVTLRQAPSKVLLDPENSVLRK